MAGRVLSPEAIGTGRNDADFANVSAGSGWFEPW
jgi:hypothetical protein